VLDIAVGDFAIADRDHAMRVEAAHVAAGDAGVDRVDLAVGHQLGFLDRALDRLHGGFDVDDHALLQAARWLAAHADDLDRAVGRDLAHQRHHLGGADVEPDDDVSVGFLSHCAAPSCRRTQRCSGVPPPPFQPTAKPLL
jgi:hypothetical protein